MLAWGFTLLLVLIACLWAYFNVAGQYKSNFRHKLGPDDASPHPPPDGLPDVTIISPGRDEAEHLPRTLPRLCEQDYPRCRVIFVDDASTDATPRITADLAARYPNLTVVRNDRDPPPGWVGKCWAIHRGYEALRALERDGQNRDTSAAPDGGPPPRSLVCFTDADIDWHPSCLRVAVRHLNEHEADVVALFPRLTFGTVSEAVVQLQLVLAVGLFVPFEKAMDPEHPETLTGGAFMLVRRSLYEAIGGHEAIKGEMVDDINLGRRLKWAGGRVRVALAGDLLWCRMYDGWADMWEGLTKNAYAGLEHSPWRVAALLPAVLVANVLPPVHAVITTAWLAAAPSTLAATAWFASVLTLPLQARVLNAARRVMRLPAAYAWTLPIGSAIYAAIILASVWRYYRGGNRWKGRSYGPTLHSYAASPNARPARADAAAHAAADSSDPPDIRSTSSMNASNAR